MDLNDEDEPTATNNRYEDVHNWSLDPSESFSSSNLITSANRTTNDDDNDFKPNYYHNKNIIKQMLPLRPKSTRQTKQTKPLQYHRFGG